MSVCSIPLPVAKTVQIIRIVLYVVKYFKNFVLVNCDNQSWAFHKAVSLFWEQHTLLQIPTRLAVVAVGSDFHHVGFCLKPQLFRLETIAEPQFGNIYTG